MLEELKELVPGEMLTIDDPDVREFTENEDFNVLGVKIYSQDEGEILFLDLDGYYLVCHTFDGDPRYYIYELNADGDEDDLSDDGFRLVLKDDPLPHKMYAGRNDREVLYKATIGPVYELNVDREDGPEESEGGEIAVCEYRSKSKHHSHALIELLDTTFRVYQGFQISKNSIVL